MLIKLLLVAFVLFSSLNARENPFFNEGSEVIPMTSNADMSLAPLKNESITFPSTARVIESVTVTYKNLDGTQSAKSVTLNNSIDWHLPLFITQSYNEAQTAEELSKKTQTSKAEHSYKKILELSFISIYENGKDLKVITKDKMMRDFSLVRPHRIVFDVQKDIDIRSYFVDAPKGSVFTKIRVGNHKGYYRVVVELDGYYSYDLKTVNDNYIFELK